MNRVIKFRAWLTNSDTVTYSNGSHMEYDVTIQDGKYASVEAGWDIQGLYDYPLMQFTGLFDKNGVEIYEGDILRNNQEEATAVVRWEETGARWSFDEIGGFDDGVGRGNWDLNMGYAKNSEVIGNKYSNPELLKEEK